MRKILCSKCTANHLPAGIRKIYEATKFEAAEFQRLVLGKAKQPQQEQRFVVINGVPSSLEIEFYNCDTCGAEIKPGEDCSAWSVWTELMEPVAEWEHEYLVA